MPFPVALPAEFGRYQILRKLGEGGMGRVYLAEDSLLARRVALKIPHLDADPTAVARFQREARVAAGIDHPNLCGVHDVGQIDGVHFLTMPFLEGEPLSEHTGRPWPPAQAVGLVRQLAVVLGVLHSRGLVHRDLKAANVMLKPDGVPVLLDFGLARSFGERATRLTNTGAVVGTPAYMPPEQANGDGENLGPAADVYSLGVILYELLVGRLPFDAPNVQGLLRQVFFEAPQPLSALRSGLAPQLDGVCLKALAKSPGERFADMAEFVAALDAALDAALVAPATTSAAPLLVCPHCGKPLRLLASVQSGQGVECQTSIGGPGEAPTEDGSSAPALVTLSAASPSALPERKTTRLASWKLRRWGLAVVVAVLLALGLVVAVVVGAGLLSDNRAHDTGQHAVMTPGQPGSSAGKTQGGPAEKEPARANAPFDEAKAKELQEAWAAYLGRQVEETLDLGGERLKLVLIPPGTFRMGSPRDEPGRNRAEQRFDAEELHWVTLTHPFYLGKFEVTQAQYEAVLGKVTIPSYFSPRGGGAAKVKDEPTAYFPEEQVSWEEADTFCTLLGNKVRRRVMLPTEAQWEYACRAGTETPFYFGKACNGKQANCNGADPYGTANKGPSLGRPCEVGQYPPNAWGLCDMHGNAEEWCRDWYGPYADLPTNDPERVEKGQDFARVLRGGWYAGNPESCRAASRHGEGGPHWQWVGFRVAIRLD
jgi:formylglycine-generating enzyme required for sulfatase activity